MTTRYFDMTHDTLRSPTLDKRIEGIEDSVEVIRRNLCRECLRVPGIRRNLDNIGEQASDIAEHY